MLQAFRLAREGVDPNKLSIATCMQYHYCWVRCPSERKHAAAYSDKRPTGSAQKTRSSNGVVLRRRFTGVKSAEQLTWRRPRPHTSFWGDWRPFRGGGGDLGVFLPKRRIGVCGGGRRQTHPFRPVLLFVYGRLGRQGRWGGRIEVLFAPQARKFWWVFFSDEWFFGPVSISRHTTRRKLTMQKKAVSRKHQKVKRKVVKAGQRAESLCQTNYAKAEKPNTWTLSVRSVQYAESK